MSRSRFFRRFTALVATLALAAALPGYVFILDDTGCVSTWREGTIPMQVKLNDSQVLSDGATQAQSVIAAMTEWNQYLGTVQFVGTVTAPNSYGIWDGTSEIVMDSAIRSDGETVPFGEYVLAVTISFEEGNTISESDIIFNTAWKWDSFRGGQIGDKDDIRRVAAHELGHVLSLDHPDEHGQGTIPALMRSLVSYAPSVEGPLQDDIYGVHALYGSPGFVPDNDNFADAATIAMEPEHILATATGTNAAATSETGEPILDPDDPGGRTVWWKWTSPAGGSVTVTTAGSRFDTLLGAYTGTAVNALTQLALNDDVESGVQRQSTITFDVDYGKTYYLAVDGWGGTVGPIQLNINLTRDPSRSPPRFVARPLTRNVLEGSHASFAAELDQGSAVTLVWRRNGVLLPGQTGPEIVIPAASQADRGIYELTATNAIGSARAVFAINVVPVGATLAAWGSNSFGERDVPSDLIDVARVAAGDSVAAAVKMDGALVAWGDPTNGLTLTPSLSGAVVDLSLGRGHGLVLREDGKVFPWGAADPAARSVPFDLSNVVAVEAGWGTSTALRANGTVVAWGATLGKSMPSGMTDVISIASKSLHTLALRSDGTVVGWGLDDHGEATPPAGLTYVIAIAANGSVDGGFSLALKADGSVVAWGSNSHGQCDVPQGLTGVVSIAAGARSALALKSDGTLVAWGSNAQGQTSAPANLDTILDVEAGTAFSLALLRPVPPQITAQPLSSTMDEGGTATFMVSAKGSPPLSFQWKRYGTALSEDDGVFGATTDTLLLSPVTLATAGAYSVVVSSPYGSIESAPATLEVNSVVSISARPHSANVEEGDAVAFEVGVPEGEGFTFQWRHNREVIPGASGRAMEIPAALAADRGYYEVLATNSLGKTSTAVFYLTVAIDHAVLTEWGGNPIEPPTVDEPVSEIGKGNGYGLALKRGGSIVSWGNANPGLPAATSGLTDVVGLSAGASHALAVKSDGTVVGWGRNDFGQATPPAGLTGVVAVSAGPYASIALKSNGTVVTWGDSRGGEPDVASIRVPAGLQGVVAVKAVPKGFLALRSDGTLAAWGKSGFDSYLPSGVSDLVTFDADGSRFVGLRSDGTIITSGISTPAPAITSARASITGNDFGAVLAADGTLVPWGLLAGVAARVPEELGEFVSVATEHSTILALTRATLPMIVQQPADQTVYFGDNVGLVAQVSGTGPFQFQWRKDGADLVEGRYIGTQNNGLYIQFARPDDAGVYQLSITNALGTVTTVEVTVRVKVPPVFLTRPLTRVVRVGHPIEIDGTATDPGPITYKWYHDGSQIPGATGPVLDIPEAAYSDGGHYWVVASNAEAEAFSTLTVNVVPDVGSALVVEGWGAINYGSPTQTAIPPALGDVVQLAAGQSRAAVLRSDGTVGLWSASPYYYPGGYEEPQTLQDIVAVEVYGAGTYHEAFALNASGKFVYYKKSTTIHSGGGWVEFPTFPPNLTRLVAITLGWNGALALRENGTVVPFGDRPVPEGLNHVTRIASGAGGGLALKDDGTVVSWPTVDFGYHPVPDGLGNVIAIAAGIGHGMALKAGGTVVSWGDNSLGQASVPAGLSNVVAIAAGANHSLALKSDGSVVAWGHDQSGQAQARPDLAPVAMISASLDYNLVLTTALKAPEILAGPVGVSVRAGENAYLTVNADGRPKPGFQWRKDGVDLPGATFHYLALSPAQISDAGSYQVMVSNSVGSVVSGPAVLAVQEMVDPPIFTPVAGTRVIGERVMLSSSSPGASFRYTTDGTTPTSTNGLVYNGPITITEAVVIRAIAYKEGASDSTVSSASYDVVPNLVPSGTVSSLPRGVVGFAYAGSLAEGGGNGVLKWAVTSGGLPSGLELSLSGEITGSPAGPGAFSFQASVSDSDLLAGPDDEDSLQLVITIDAENSVPAITTTALPDGGLGLAYSQSLSGSGGNGPLKWSIASGSLPPGVTLSEGGLISGSPQSLGTYNFTVRVGDDDTITGTTDEDTKALAITVSAAPRLVNVSMRAFAGSGGDTLIVGFYIAGTGSKTVLIRGIGPKLLDQNVPSVVADPRITLYSGSTPVASNDNWESSLAFDFAAVGAFALNPGSKDAAMLATLEPGPYTIHLVNDGPVAEALVEVYDRSQDAGTRLVNISSRLRIRAGQTAIMGTYLTGGSLGVLARNIGPGLQLVSGDLTAGQVLPDPRLTVYSGSTPIATNDDWEPAMQPYFAASGAFGLNAGSKDSALRSQFQVGAYTVHAVSNTGEGIALIEIYESP